MKLHLPRTIFLLILSYLPGSVVAGSEAADSQLSFSVGYEQTSGDYGLDNDTDITTVPFNLQYINEAWRFKLSVPFISVTGDGSVIPGTNGVIAGDLTSIFGVGQSGGTSSTSVVETQSGPGDIMSSLSYAFLPENQSNMFYEMTAEVKWGTASAEKFLGTGENDYSLSLFSMYERYDLKPFLSLGYLVMGDSQVTDYNDVMFVTTGFMYQLNSKTLVSIAYDFQQTTIDGTDDGKTLSVYLNRVLGEKWSASAYLLNGLSDSVADTGFGLNLIRNF